MFVCNKKVAVCILTYNRKELLKKTIASVLQSSSKDYEIFVFNDNSTDGTNEYLEFMEKKGFLKEYRQNKNVGLYKNANTIIENIDAKYCLMLNDDDILDKNYLEETLKLANSDNDISIIGTAWNKIDENDEIIDSILYKSFKESVVLNDKDFFLHNLSGLNFPWGGTLIRMDKIGNLRFNSEYYGTGADSIFLCNLALGNKVGYIPKPLFNYRIHKHQITQEEDISDILQSLEKWGKIWEFYDNLILNYFGNNKRLFLNKHNKAINKTIIYLLQECKDIKIFLKILSSRRFSFSLINISQLKSIIIKLIKLLLSKNRVKKDVYRIL